MQNDRSHETDVNCVSMNPSNEFFLATGSSDNVCHLFLFNLLFSQTVKLWDIRSGLSHPLYTFTGHQDEVYQIEWSLFAESIFASGGKDRRLHIWDIGRIGEKQVH